MTGKDNQSSDTMRLDKWLWCARFFKTRGLAAEAVKTGKVKVNGEKMKPAKTVRAGEALAIRRGPYTYEITVIGLAKSRRSAAEAALLYKEHEDSISTRELTAAQLKANSAMFPHTKGRPTKRERRDLTKFKQTPDS